MLSHVACACGGSTVAGVDVSQLMHACKSRWHMHVHYATCSLHDAVSFKVVRLSYQFNGMTA